MADVTEAVYEPDLDEVDHALDKLDFVTCTLSFMLGEYSDKVVCGLVTTMVESVATLREYVAATTGGKIG